MTGTGYPSNNNRLPITLSQLDKQMPDPQTRPSITWNKLTHTPPQSLGSSSRLRGFRLLLTHPRQNPLPSFISPLILAYPLIPSLVCCHKTMSFFLQLCLDIIGNCFAVRRWGGRSCALSNGLLGMAWYSPSPLGYEIRDFWEIGRWTFQNTFGCSAGDPVAG